MIDGVEGSAEVEEKRMEIEPESVEERISLVTLRRAVIFYEHSKFHESTCSLFHDLLWPLKPPMLMC